MQRKYFVPQRLAVNEERLFPQDASDRELLHLGQASVLLQYVKMREMRSGCSQWSRMQLWVIILLE